LDSKNNKKIGGVIPPMITPVNQDGSADEHGLKKVIDHCINGGVHGLFVLGSAGEGMNFNRMERNRVIKISIEHADNRVPVLCGVLDTATAKVIENIKAAEQMGAQYVVATPAFYYDCVSQSEVVRHFEKICASTTLNVISYNIPGLTHVNMQPSTVMEICEIDNLIAHKESTGNWEQFQNLLFLFEGKDFPIITGPEEFIGASLLFGSNGCVPCMANFYPKIYAKLYEHAVSKKTDEVYKYQKAITHLGNSIAFCKSWVSGLKYVGKITRLCKEYVTLPIEPLIDSEKRQIEDLIEDFKKELSEINPDLL